jgi:hypothetical protein
VGPQADHNGRFISCTLAGNGNRLINSTQLNSTHLNPYILTSSHPHICLNFPSALHTSNPQRCLVNSSQAKSSLPSRTIVSTCISSIKLPQQPVTKSMLYSTRDEDPRPRLLRRTNSHGRDQRSDSKSPPILAAYTETRTDPTPSAKSYRTSKKCWNFRAPLSSKSSNTMSTWRT